jgi:plastocyanin
METAVKIIITVLFIALIAIAIVFFGVFGLLPLKKIKVFVEKPAATSTLPEKETPPPTPIVPATSPVTSEGEVVTKEGKPVRLDVLPGSPEAPQESNPISPEDLPSEAIKLTITAAGISPSSFTVRAGAPVTISVTSGDTQTHIFKFDSPSLSAVAVGVSPGETRAITFNAPGKGTYGFHCDVPGHASRGETGTMTVR